jgi:hypothetical protein
MVVTAVLFAIVTVLAGVVALGDVVMSDAGVGAKRLAVAHVSLASVGIILLLVAVVAVNRGPAWASFTALLVAGGLGLTTLILTRRPRRRAVDDPPSGGVPLPVIVIPGAAAVITIVSVLVAAAGTGLVRH